MRRGCGRACCGSRSRSRSPASASTCGARTVTTTSNGWSMRVDVVAVGTELLLGQIVDTNSSWIGEQLAAHGFTSQLQYKVGDNLARVVSAFRMALADADAIIVCGGLGPTHDDLTRDAIAEVMGVPLETH